MDIDNPETVTVHKSEVSCDGGGALGHPKVYLTLGSDGALLLDKNSEHAHKTPILSTKVLDRIYFRTNLNP